MRHAFPLGVVLGLLSTVVVEPAVAAPQSTPVPGLTAAAQSIAPAADGSMWLTESASPGRVARVTTAGAVTEYVGGITLNFTASRAPEGVIVTSDGYAWFLMHGGSDEVGGISLATGAVYRYQLTGGTPTSLAAGADGKLWMTANGDNGGADFVARYSRADNVTTPFTTGFTAGSEPRSLTLGPDGAMWFVEGVTNGRVGRIATDGTVSYRSVGETPSTLTNGPGGLWFARNTELGLLTADSTSLFDTGAPATAIAAGPDDAMWSVGTGGALRLAADGSVSAVSSGIASNAKGMAIAAGADGRMWMTLDRAPYLVRITVPPRVGTATGTASTPTTATVTTDVRPNGIATTAALQLRAADGSWSTLSQSVVGDGVVSTPVKFDVSGLVAGATNTLRVVATSDAGTATSSEVSLDTAAAAPAPVSTTPASASAPTTPPAPDAPAATPAPVQGSTVVVRPDRGTVTYKVPGSETARTVDGAASIPTGSVIDTSKGSVLLSSQVGGADQQGRFYGGEFKVKQVKTTGATQLYLTEKLDCSTASAKVATRSAAKKKRRHVWGEDKGGNFQTHGQDSVATVRGTKWLTTDTCAGTVVKVFEGEVSVAPRRGKGKAVIVKAGGRQFTPHAR
jgi:hypothetical protein